MQAPGAINLTIEAKNLEPQEQERVKQQLIQLATLRAYTGELTSVKSQLQMDSSLLTDHDKFAQLLVELDARVAEEEAQNRVLLAVDKVLPAYFTASEVQNVLGQITKPVRILLQLNGKTVRQAELSLRQATQVRTVGQTVVLGADLSVDLARPFNYF